MSYCVLGYLDPKVYGSGKWQEHLCEKNIREGVVTMIPSVQKILETLRG